MLGVLSVALGAPVIRLPKGFAWSVFTDEVPYPQAPALAFVPPAQPLGPHVASLGIRFYTDTQFPRPYRNQIFICEYGSWN